MLWLYWVKPVLIVVSVLRAKSIFVKLIIGCYFKDTLSSLPSRFLFCATSRRTPNLMWIWHSDNLLCLQWCYNKNVSFTYKHGTVGYFVSMSLFCFFLNLSSELLRWLCVLLLGTFNFLVNYCFCNQSISRLNSWIYFLSLKEF